MIFTTESRTYQAEREEVASVDCHERLFRESWVAVEDIAEDASGSKGKTHVGEAVGQHWSKPVCLVVHCGAKAKEADCAQDHDDYHQDEAVLRLVDTVVLVGHLQADPVVQRA